MAEAALLIEGQPQLGSNCSAQLSAGSRLHFLTAGRCALLLHTGCRPSACPWQVFNAKPYHPFNPQARIVHFHVRGGARSGSLAGPGGKRGLTPPLASHLARMQGPKPNDYVQWRLTGKCRFNDLCRQASRARAVMLPASVLPGEGLAAVRPSPANQGHPPQPLLPPPLCLLLQGFAAGLCHYAAEYYTVVPEWLEAGRLVRLCHGAKG